jgi:hypothetical protein
MRWKARLPAGEASPRDGRGKVGLKGTRLKRHGGSEPHLRPEVANRSIATPRRASPSGSLRGLWRPCILSADHMLLVGLTESEVAGR